MLTRGTRIVKQNSEPGDGHPDGSEGTILEVQEIPKEKSIEISRKAYEAGVEFLKDYVAEAMYIISWDDAPGIPVWTTDYKVKAK